MDRPVLKMPLALLVLKEKLLQPDVEETLVKLDKERPVLLMAVLPDNKDCVKAVLPDSESVLGQIDVLEIVTEVMVRSQRDNLVME